MDRLWLKHAPAFIGQMASGTFSVVSRHIRGSQLSRVCAIGSDAVAAVARLEKGCEGKCGKRKQFLAARVAS